MNIGETIRSYRKKENLTQQQIANYLNVSTPAVNKWEKGISSPDIMLLAPLARILKIDVNTLLSFNSVLTSKEINEYLDDICLRMSENGFEKGFERAEELLKSYPNCDILLARIAETMNMFLETDKDIINNYDKYDKKIISWYKLLCESNNERTSIIGKYDLAIKYIRRKEYDKAQIYLDSIPKEEIPNLTSFKKILQAQIFEDTDRKSAYEIYEDIVLTCANEIMAALSFIIKNLCNEEKYDIAEEYSEIYKKTGELYDLNLYSRIVNHLTIPIAQNDKEKVIKNFKDIIYDMEHFSRDTKSNIYRFRKFREEADVEIKRCKTFLNHAISNGKQYEFIRDDKDIKALIKNIMLIGE